MSSQLQMLVLHSLRNDGSHWFITLDNPAVQVWPVMANQWRAGYLLANLVSYKLAKLATIPEELELSTRDIRALPALWRQYPEISSQTPIGHVRVLLMSWEAPPEERASHEAEYFLTPQPALDWHSGYHEWIYWVAQTLGIEIPLPAGEESYTQALFSMIDQVQSQLPAVRWRYLKKMLYGQHLLVKVALPTVTGGEELIWLDVVSWLDPDWVVGVLKTEPYQCDDYWYGQQLRMPVSGILDYAIGTDLESLAEPSLMQRLAENYGRRLR